MANVQQYQVELVKKRQADGCRFYVVGIRGDGLKMWSGPFLTRDDADLSNKMRDKSYAAFVVEDRNG